MDSRGSDPHRRGDFLVDGTSELHTRDPDVVECFRTTCREAEDPLAAGGALIRRGCCGSDRPGGAGPSTAPLASAVL